MPLPDALPMAGGRVGYDVRDIIAALKDAEIVFINWPTPGGGERGRAVFGFTLAADPDVLEFGVRNEHEAAAVGEAKQAVDAGNDLGAYMALRALAVPETLPTH
jgi:hypothetical protein